MTQDIDVTELTIAQVQDGLARGHRPSSPASRGTIRG
jgi:hypothetical protein